MVDYDRLFFRTFAQRVGEARAFLHLQNGQDMCGDVSDEIDDMLALYQNRHDPQWQILDRFFRIFLAEKHPPGAERDAYSDPKILDSYAVSTQVGVCHLFLWATGRGYNRHSSVEVAKDYCRNLEKACQALQLHEAFAVRVTPLPAPGTKSKRPNLSIVK